MSQIPLSVLEIFFYFILKTTPWDVSYWFHFPDSDTEDVRDYLSTVWQIRNQIQVSLQNSWLFHNTVLPAWIIGGSEDWDPKLCLEHINNQFFWADCVWRAQSSCIFFFFALNLNKYHLPIMCFCVITCLR